MSLNLDCLVISSEFDSKIFSKKLYRGDVGSFSVYHKRHMMPLCPVIGRVMFNQRIKVLPARFLHCKGIFFLFIINK